MIKDFSELGVTSDQQEKLTIFDDFGPQVIKKLEELVKVHSHHAGINLCVTTQQYFMGKSEITQTLRNFR